MDEMRESLLKLEYNVRKMTGGLMMQMAELKTCPFCSGEPTIIVRRGKDGWRDRYAVLCDYEHGGCGAESGWYHYESEAIAAWNRRVGDEE